MAFAFGGRSTSPLVRSLSLCLILVGNPSALEASIFTHTYCPTGFIYFASWTYFTSTYWPQLPNMGKCAGEEFAAIAGICIITSYLFLFLAFYFATYKKPVPKGRRRATSALVEMKDEKVPTVGEARRRLSTSRVGQVVVGTTTGASPNGRATRSRKA